MQAGYTVITFYPNKSTVNIHFVDHVSFIVFVCCQHTGNHVLWNANKSWGNLVHLQQRRVLPDSCWRCADSQIQLDLVWRWRMCPKSEYLLKKQLAELQWGCKVGRRWCGIIYTRKEIHTLWGKMCSAQCKDRREAQS